MLYAVLVHDHQLRPISKIFRVRNGAASEEVRLVQTSYERRPASSVPGTAFQPTGLDMRLPNRDGLSTALQEQNKPQETPETNVRLAQMQIAELYQLGQIGADTSDPIEVTRRLNGHIIVAGTVTDVARKEQIRSALESLPERQFLEIHLASQCDLHMPSSTLQAGALSMASVYNFTQIEAPLTSCCPHTSIAKVGQQIA